MLKSVYDSNNDGVIAVAQTEADMTKAVYDPALADISALLAAHKTQHQNGGTDEINATGLTGVPVAPLLVDGVAGRRLRKFLFRIDDGTNADTIKCNAVNYFNSTTITPVDNIGKGATVSGFTLDADGKELRVEAAILEGNCLYAHCALYRNYNGTIINPGVISNVNDIKIIISSEEAGTILDMTTWVQTGKIDLTITYITDA
ncbi:hypothetical protein ES703_54963 [subsurface metagenome]